MLASLVYAAVRLLLDLFLLRAHCNAARSHRALELRAALARGRPARPPSRVEEVIHRDRLGRLIHEYEPLAG